MVLRTQLEEPTEGLPFLVILCSPSRILKYPKNFIRKTALSIFNSETDNENFTQVSYL